LFDVPSSLALYLFQALLLSGFDFRLQTSFVSYSSTGHW
jgi:hypothetical protein